MYFYLLLAAVLLLPAYVGARTGAIPWIARRVPIWGRLAVPFLLASGYVTARVIERNGWPRTASVVEWIAATTIGVLFLCCVALLAVDLVTAFGWFFRRHVPRLRRLALAAGVVLSAVAIVQGMRAPVVRDYEVRLKDLPRHRDGTVLLFVSDLHLGSLTSRSWLAARVEQMAAQRADAIFFGGDLLEGHNAAEAAMLPLLGRLSAPLGVYAVPGNHDGYGRPLGSVKGLEEYGVRVLQNEWVELRPGLVVAGVETRSHGPSRTSGAIAEAMAGRPPGAAILLSHAPVHVEDAASAGAGLMLAGHTHDGQLWPFRQLFWTAYPFPSGRYEVGPMTLIVCRGTGTFGPPMRLWYPSEMLRVTLRAAG